MESRSAMSNWDRATTLEPRASGVYEGDISGAWNAGTRPNGGYLMALGAKAMALTGPFSDPFTVTCHFLSAADVGPARFDVEAIRSGRTLATLGCSMVQEAKQRTRLLGVFGELSRPGGYSRVALEPPELPKPDDCVRALPALSNGVALPINNEAEIRFQPGTTLAADGEPSGEPSVAAWFRLADGADPDVFLLFLAADAFVPAVNELGITSWSPTIELTVHVRAHPAPGWLRVVRTTNVLWNSYFEEDSEIWDSEDKLVAQGRQFARLGAGPTPPAPGK